MTLLSPRRRSGPAWILLAPALSFFLLFLIIPMGFMLILSVREFEPATGQFGGLTFQHYLRVLSDSYYWHIMGRTIKLGLMVTSICLVLGYPVAYHFYTVPPGWRSALGLIIVSPLLISVVIRTFGWLVILAPNGLINEGLATLGIVREPLSLLYTEGAIVVGLTHVLLPFMILSIISALEMIQPSLVSAAENLGASAWGAFWRVTVPLSFPGVISGALIVFTLSTSALITPAMLGGTMVKVFSFLVYQQVLHLLNWSFGAALVYVLLIITGTLVVLVTRLAQKRVEAVVMQ